MRTLVMIVLSVSLAAGCSKKKNTDEVESGADFDLPIVVGRNVDSLKHLSYEARILAFSIELGHRSTDFNQRLGLIIGSITTDKSWRDVVEQRIAAPNYRSAEWYNRTYLDSLFGLLNDPPASFAESHQELKSALQRLHANYEVLGRYESYSSMSAILDSVLLNEQVINRSLNNFKSVIEMHTKPASAKQRG